MGSVSRWISQIRDGRDSAVTRMWKRFEARISMRASRRMTGLPTNLQDQEDLVQSTFFACVNAIRTPGTSANLHMTTRLDFWKHLSRVIKNAVIDLSRKIERRGGDYYGLSLDQQDNRTGSAVRELCVDYRERRPDEIVSSEDEVERLKRKLQTDVQPVAREKLMGFTNQEIADRLGYSLRKVERSLNAIRVAWGSELAAAGAPDVINSESDDADRETNERGPASS